MYTTIANTTFSYVLTMDEFRNTIPEKHKPSWIKITTITMVSSFKQDIDIPKLRNFFNKFQTLRIGNFEWNLKPTTFYNQITLTYVDTYSTKSIKLFPNGSIQVAGCSDLFDCNRVISQLSALLKKLLGMNEIPTDSFRVVMINSNFSINYDINLMVVAQTFKQVPDYQVSFDPDRYSAVKIKFKPHPEAKQVTASIFSTGKVIVTGAETLKEIAFAYKKLNTLIFQNKDNIKVTERTEKELFGIFMGHKVTSLVENIKKMDVRPWPESVSNLRINF